ncbi:MAG: DUF896 domain-containing protein [Clostridia bacterium]|nr:DUF896 domain-containing protein [Clostridia bacterium]MBR2472337.1 DUF896 domain-containing protein [Clostridia bacterium]MBR3865672.1 DUF896 domain-containing protein [Clostridia bacterium]
MDQKKIDRINELARLAKERELTQEEQAERAKLRREYIDAYVGNLRATLENTVIVRPDGTKEKITPKS